MSDARGRPPELSDDEAAWARDIAGQAAKTEDAPAVKSKKKRSAESEEPPLDSTPPADGTNIPMARGLVGDARSDGKPHPAWADYTHRGNGERVVDAHANDLRHAPEGGWFEWDGKRWAPDPGSKRALKRAMDTLVAMALEARTSPGLDADDHKFIERSQSPGEWGSALTTASLYAPIATSFDAFDDGRDAPKGHETRFNVLNGTVDLELGQLRPHRREDMITKLAGASFLPPSECSTLWVDFLAKAQPDAEIRAFLQRLAGYWLFGGVRDEVFPINWGQGGNGKGTFLDTIRRSMGEYAGTVPDDVLVSQHQKPHPTGLMTFRGLRLAIASEQNESDTIALGTLKRLTGGDEIRARFMGKDFVSFEPTHKLVLMLNPRPKLGGNVGASLKRRIFFIPWEQIFEAGAKGTDTELKTKLSEAPALAAVLAWQLEGYRTWRRVGLAPPASVLAATSDFLRDEDTIAAFVEERLDLGPSLSVSADDLYKAYKVYCKETGETAILRVQDFKSALLAKEALRQAGVYWKRHEDARTYHGCELRPRTADDYVAREQSGRWGGRAS